MCYPVGCLGLSWTVAGAMSGSAQGLPSILESMTAPVLVESDSAGVGCSMGHLHTLAAMDSMGHLNTLVQQEVFPSTGRPAFHAMEVFVHRATGLVQPVHAMEVFVHQNCRACSPCCDRCEM